jgi:hypothetical protein
MSDDPHILSVVVRTANPAHEIAEAGYGQVFGCSFYRPRVMPSTPMASRARS